jgi:hypothetical protein
MFANYFPSIMALIAIGTQVEDTINNGPIDMKFYMCGEKIENK